MTKISIGADIGGSHICCAAVDIDQHILIPQTASDVKINNQGSAEEILNGWAQAIEETIQKVKGDIIGIGFAMPGPFNYAKGIAMFERVQKYESLYGISVTDELSRRLSAKVPLRYINDATAFAIAEAWMGEGKNFRNLLALTLGTGFGSAFVKEAIPVLEGDTVPRMGCLYHIPYEDGIADDPFSTRWFVNTYKQETGKTVDGVKTIADEARQGHRFAKGLFEMYGTKLGNFLPPWLKKFSADGIVLGGNVSGAFDLFGPFMKEAMHHAGVDIPVAISTLKEDAAIIGSARLADEKYWDSVKELIKKM